MRVQEAYQNKNRGLIAVAAWLEDDQTLSLPAERLPFLNDTPALSS